MKFLKSLLAVILVITMVVPTITVFAATSVPYKKTGTVYTVGGKSYYQAKTTSAYNGVSAGTDFWLDSSSNIVTDASILTKLLVLKNIGTENFFSLIESAMKSASDAAHGYYDVFTSISAVNKMGTIVGNFSGRALSLMTNTAYGFTDIAIDVGSEALSTDNIKTVALISMLKIYANNCDAKLNEVENLKKSASTNYDSLITMIDCFAESQACLTAIIYLAGNDIEEYVNSSLWNKLLNYFKDVLGGIADAVIPDIWAVEVFDALADGTMNVIPLTELALSTNVDKVFSQKKQEVYDSYIRVLNKNISSSEKSIADKLTKNTSSAPSSSTSNYTTGTYKPSEWDGLNMRSGAATSYSKVGAIAAGTNFVVTQVNGIWGKTTCNGVTGWVCLDYATKVSSSGSTVTKLAAPQITNKTTFTTDENVKLTWSALNGADYYGITVKNDNTGATVFDDDIKNNYLDLGRLSAGKYRWQVRGHNSAGWGNLTSLTYFTVSAPVNKLSAPTITNKTTFTTDENVKLTWSALSGADYYGITVRNNSTGATMFDDDISNNYLDLGKLAAGKYRWQVRGHNSAGWGDLTNLMYFTIEDDASDAGVNVSDKSDYAIFPAKILGVTQGAYGSFSHNGEYKQNAFDLCNDNKNYFAPFDGTITAIKTSYNAVVLQSDKKVHWADGTYDYMSVCFVHDNDISDLYIGKKIKQGENFYQPGKKAPPGEYCDVHVHLCVNKGQTNAGINIFSGDVYPNDAFFITEDIRITKDGGYTWRKLTINKVETQTYTVTYNSNGGSGTPKEQTKTAGEDLKLSSTEPTRNGYKFLGWATSKTGNVKFESGDNYTDDKNITLYAVWEEIKTYTIKYNANGGSGAPSSQTKTHGESIKVSVQKPTRSGYEFDGWATSANGNVEYDPSENYTKDSDITLYAVWKPLTYKVTYNANGGTGAPAAQAKIHNEKLYITDDTPERDGYSFVGWATTKTGSISYKAGQQYTSDKDITLYAVWEANTYTISYNANGGSSAPKNQTKKYAESIKLSTQEPTRKDYIFLGWSTSAQGSVEFAPGSVCSENENITLYALWQEEENEVYYIIYNANGGKNAPSMQTKNEDEDITISEVVPTREGYTFDGWAVGNDDTVVYSSEDTYKENKTLYLHAVWTANTYTISYNTNGGVGAPRNQTKIHDEDIVLSTVEPEKEDCVFIGWSDDPYAEYAKYYTEDTFSENSDTVLYAVWEEIIEEDESDEEADDDKNQSQNEIPFEDVPEDAWYRKDVENAYKNGLINGKSEKRYAPGDNMTYAEAIKLACTIYQLYYDGEVTLTNGSDVWYSTYMDYALENRIVRTDYSSVANEYVTRKEFVNIFYGALPLKEFAKINNVEDNIIPDVKIGDAYSGEIYTFYRAGILTGNDVKGTFKPDSNISRSEVAAIVTRMLDSGARKKIDIR